MPNFQYSQSGSSNPWVAAGQDLRSDIYNILGWKGNDNVNTFNWEAMQSQFNFNMALQQQQQKWLEEMSSTAHQREVTDLKAAGLNPLLSTGAGASTPNGGLNSVGLADTTASAVQARQNKMQNMLQLAQLAINKMTASAEANKANEEAITEGYKRWSYQAQAAGQELDNIMKSDYYEKYFDAKQKAEIQQMRANIGLMNANAILSRAQAIYLPQESSAKQEEARANAKFANERSRGFGIFETANRGIAKLLEYKAGIKWNELYRD